jgi:hypothetical protein
MVNRIRVSQERTTQVWRSATTVLQCCIGNRRVIMELASPRFAIVFEPATREPRTALKATHDANEATVAFHTALRLLRAQGTDGHVLLQKDHGEIQILLREPVLAGGR